MRQRTLATALSALLVLVAAPGCSRGGPAAPVSASFVAVDTTSGSVTDRAIGAAQDRLRTEPTNHKARLALAQAFLQKARETADPTFYGKADQLLASVHDTDDPGVLIAQGTLALARHQFTEGLRLGRAALALAPESEAALGVIVDASNELGRYRQALDATQRMVDAKPNLASLSRVSYARELHGDLPGAVTAMAAAATAGGAAGGENIAYVQTQLGLLLLTTGDRVGASHAFDAADLAFPGFAAARVGRARLLVAEGRDAGAARLLAEAVDVQPLADTVALQGDVLTALGDRAGAHQAYALVDVIARLFRANGVRTDLEMALFAADHHPGATAVAAARRALAERPSILGHDVLAWNLQRAGDARAAWVEVGKALVTGSRDPQLRFHAAVIAEATGHRSAAERHLRVVLDTNPRFSPWHDVEVQRLAARLGLRTDTKGSMS